MAVKKKSNTTDSDEFLAGIRKEIMALFLLALGVFYYLCILSYSPQDPSLFSSSSHFAVQNMGGVFGAYLSGSVFFLLGGGGYFIGFYFLLNALFFFAGRRENLRALDFFVFLVCSTFIAIFLQLQFQEFSFGDYQVNAGGSIGQLLAELGETYLGTWGVYITVVFGVLLTFILATKLSVIDAFSQGTVVIGKGVGGFGERLIFVLARMRKLYQSRLQAWKDNREEEDDEDEYEEEYEEDEDDEYEEDDEEEDEDEYEEPEIALPAKKKAASSLPRKKLQEVLSSHQVVEPKIRERKDTRAKAALNQMELENISEGYQLPPLAFLDYEDTTDAQVDIESLKMSARILESKLKDFSIDGRVTEIHPGPVITMYEFEPAPGVKLSRINSLTDDLSLAMGGRPVRIVAPLPKKAAIGIEIPNHGRETVWLKDVIADDRFQKSESKLVFALGKDIEGIPYTADLQKMPHLLVAGSTGSGKSVSINTMICSILYNAKPDEVRMIMIDPKMIELSIYEGIPHLLLPVVTDPKKASLSLKWAVREMEKRYQLLADVNARNITGYNKLIESGDFVSKQKEAGEIREGEDPLEHKTKLPFIVIVIDEFADLMMVASKDVEECVCRLAQKARAAGIHVILATQRPSVDVITGIIKANFPSRIAFRVTSKHDSRTILDTVGAEHLLGMGDMLFVPPGSSKMTRLHGAYISEHEIVRIVDFLKGQAKPMYNEEILRQPEPGEPGAEPSEDFDEYYDQAVRRVCEAKRVSISSIQRQFRIGYNRAARIVEQMEEQGVVSPPNGQGQREVLVDAI
ncbi:MAG: DNA translocase FtsK 4TM domain-containing protein [Deltaproteobacteria bacterium]|nr:DNA translocase FtsK 4TM domain-containing protein [Deltaproteobacteria bacterium]